MHLVSLLRWTLIPALCLSYEALTNDDIERMLWISPIILSLGLLSYDMYHQQINYHDSFYLLFVLLGLRDLLLNPRDLIEIYIIWGRFILITGYRMIMITCLLYVIQSVVRFLYYHTNPLSLMGTGFVMGTLLMYRKF
jgi:hypothetical protein